jgi:uncharacterized protein YeaO (DUF488 family)
MALIAMREWARPAGGLSSITPRIADIPEGIGEMTKPRRVSDIQVKRVYDAPDKRDGARVLVDRLWPRGLSKEKAALTLWLKDVAPSPELRTWFGHDPARWAEFQRRYRAELGVNDAAVVQLVELLRHGRVTLLYGAHDHAHNNAVALEAFLRDHLKNDHGRSTSPMTATRNPV